MLQNMIINSMVKLADTTNIIQQPPAESHTIRNLAVGAAVVGAGVLGAKKLGIKLPKVTGAAPSVSVPNIPA